MINHFVGAGFVNSLGSAPPLPSMLPVSCIMLQDMIHDFFARRINWYLTSYILKLDGIHSATKKTRSSRSLVLVMVSCKMLEYCLFGVHLSTGVQVNLFV